MPSSWATTADINLVDAIKRVSGVGDVKNFTAQDYSMRIWLEPNKMAALGITPEDVAERRPRAERPSAGRTSLAPSPPQADRKTNTTCARLVC